MMNPWGSKHVEGVKNRMEVLIWKVCISLVYNKEGGVVNQHN